MKADSAQTPGNDAKAMDDLLMAMDVVDTLRYEDELVRKELGQDERDETLKQRLREIYEGQGLVVTDRILDEGIRALREDRFVYRPQGGWFARHLAGLWVRRTRCLAVSGVLLLVIGGVVLQNYRGDLAEQRLQAELTTSLPKELAAAASFALSQAGDAQARERIGALRAGGESALMAGDAAKAKEAIADLKQISRSLTESFKLRIVSRPGAYSAVFRVPDDNPKSRNYYIIVEAIGDDGKVIPQDIVNEESNASSTVTQWGQRVPFKTYEAVRGDKMDDGIIQNNIVGEKPRGSLSVRYTISVQNGAITQW
ncbi:MAG: DUF6384 family protein [Azoarcus sp.]|jgi:hypothetical protein|nr:DUF6384 family protein [Azoarcus sp.]